MTEQDNIYRDQLYPTKYSDRYTKEELEAIKFFPGGLKGELALLYILNRFENWVFTVLYDVVFWHSPKEKLCFSCLEFFQNSKAD